MAEASQGGIRGGAFRDSTLKAGLELIVALGAKACVIGVFFSAFGACDHEFTYLASEGEGQERFCGGIPQFYFAKLFKLS